MIKIEKEYVSSSGSRYIRSLEADAKSENIKWQSHSRRIKRARYLSYEQWVDIERQVREAYAEEYDVDFSSIFEIYPRDHRKAKGILFFETFKRGDDQFGHSSNIQYIGDPGTFDPSAAQSISGYESTNTASFSFYAEQAKEEKRSREPEPQNRMVKIDYSAIGISRGFAQP